MSTLTIERPVEMLVEAEPGTLVIDVRQEHIDKGRRGNGWNCPIALAAKDAGVARLFMGAGELMANGQLWRCPEAARFVRDFDHQQPVYPQQLTFRRVP